MKETHQVFHRGEAEFDPFHVHGGKDKYSPEVGKSGSPEENTSTSRGVREEGSREGENTNTSRELIVWSRESGCIVGK